MPEIGAVISGRYDNRDVTCSDDGELGIDKIFGRRAITTRTVASWQLVRVQHRKRRPWMRRTVATTVDVVASTLALHAPWWPFLNGEKRRWYYIVRLDWLDGGHSLLALPGPLLDRLSETVGAPAAPPMSGRLRSSSSLPPPPPPPVAP
jgi:hypothetical protein